MIAAPVQCDVDGVPKGSHSARVSPTRSSTKSPADKPPSTGSPIRDTPLTGFEPVTSSVSMSACPSAAWTRRRTSRVTTVEALGEDLEQDLDRVPGPLGHRGGRHAAVEPGGHGPSRTSGAAWGRAARTRVVCGWRPSAGHCGCRRGQLGGPGRDASAVCLSSIRTVPVVGAVARTAGRGTRGWDTFNFPRARRSRSTWAPTSMPSACGSVHSTSRAHRRSAGRPRSG